MDLENLDNISSIQDLDDLYDLKDDLEKYAHEELCYTNDEDNELVFVDEIQEKLDEIQNEINKRDY